MYPRTNTLGIAIRVLMAASLLIFLVGCGNSSGNKQSTIPSPAPAGTNSPSTQKGFDVAGLLHIEPESITCTLPVHPVFIFPQGNLVRTNERSTYDSGELQQMTAYAQALYDRKFGDGTAVVPPIPATFQWLQGGPGCIGSLALTNIGSTFIQLQSIDMRLTATPRSNSNRYRLIEVCSLLSAAEKAGCPGSAGGIGPLGYDYKFSNVSIGTVFHPQSPHEITLNPGDVASIMLVFHSVGSPDNFIYTAIPELVLGTGTIELKQLVEVLSFADEGQFSCAKLKNNTFIPVDVQFKSAAPDEEGQWCL